MLQTDYETAQFPPPHTHMGHVNCNNNMASARGQLCPSYTFGCSSFRLSWIRARPVLNKRLCLSHLYTIFAINNSLLIDILDKIKSVKCLCGKIWKGPK